MFKTDRFRERQFQLSDALKIWRLRKVWKDYVRSALRQQPIMDLHDYYDFHLNLNGRLEVIREESISGAYQPNSAIRIRSEKNNGISRQIVFLYPADALVLEALADFLEPIIRKSQPTGKAFYSRNKKMPPGMQDVDLNFGYPWWVLWPQFQEQIFGFAKNNEYLVVTDVANYFDGIGFSQLRNFLASLDHFSEVYLDFLFFMLERFVWRPDYLPHPGRGLPQIQLDAPRMLAHAFLYEIDKYLDQNTGGQFVRWLDDVDFGCESIEKAKSLLRGVDELLLSRGLHLNGSKTKVLSAKEAMEHFQVKENVALNVVTNSLAFRRYGSGRRVRLWRRHLRRRYRDFLGQEPVGNYKKVLKRYFTLFGRLGDASAESKAVECLFEDPSLRNAVFGYWARLGWTAQREQHVIEYMEVCVDDESFFGCVNLLIRWLPPQYGLYIARMRMLARRYVEQEGTRFLGAVWLLACFGSHEDVEKIVLHRTKAWRMDQWMARQVAALYPLMTPDHVRQSFDNLVSRYGLKDAQSVILNYGLVGSDEVTFRKYVSPYLKSPTGTGEVPVYKLLSALAAFTGTLGSAVVDDTRKTMLGLTQSPLWKRRLRV